MGDRHATWQILPMIVFRLNLSSNLKGRTVCRRIYRARMHRLKRRCNLAMPHLFLVPLGAGLKLSRRGLQIGQKFFQMGVLRRIESRSSNQGRMVDLSIGQAQMRAMTLGVMERKGKRLKRKQALLLEAMLMRAGEVNKALGKKRIWPLRTGEQRRCRSRKFTQRARIVRQMKRPIPIFRCNRCPTG